MKKEQLRNEWKTEEAVAKIHGWDFSHIHGRYTEESDLPWDYGEIILSYLREEDSLLDIDTGGGEFLLSLGHSPNKTSATEGYPPNVALCEQLLKPMGMDFREASDCTSLPFEDETFDIVINRHGEYDVQELYRILKPNGLFITQQVGENNDRELVELLLPGTPKPFHGLNLQDQIHKFEKAGFAMIRGEEAYKPIRFFDVGALVWFAKIIEWEFPEFSVDKCFENLLHAQAILEEKESIDGTIHRYLIVAQKLKK